MKTLLQFKKLTLNSLLLMAMLFISSSTFAQVSCDDCDDIISDPTEAVAAGRCESTFWSIYL